MKTLKDFNVSNKRVLVRTDFNIPFSGQGDILDDFRIVQTLPTIEYLIENKAKTILISHLGRPISKQRYTLKPVALRLEKLLKRKVKFLDDCIGEEVKKVIAEMELGEVVLLENLRFHRGEMENDPKLAKQLAKLGDIFIQEAFAACHRKHSSIVGIPKYLSSGIGFLVEKEIECLSKISNKPKNPLVVIIGGKKVETKAKLINKLSKIADWILLGHLMKKEVVNKNFWLKNPQKIIAPIDGIKEKRQYFDIGPKTIDLFSVKIFQAKTIFWNGQLGKTEEKKFTKGSLAIADAIIKSKAYSVAAGGNTIAFLGQYNLRDKFDFVSTGGGAALAFLSGEKLPGIKDDLLS